MLHELVHGEQNLPYDLRRQYTTTTYAPIHFKLRLPRNSLRSIKYQISLLFSS